MKKQILFKSALSLVAAAAAGSAWATVTTNAFENFESYTPDSAITNYANWSAVPDSDGSKVVSVNGGKVLALATEGAELTRTLDPTTTATDAAPVFFEAEVKFVPSDTIQSGLPTGTDNTKFALYAYAPEGGATNLVVYHAYTVDGPDDSVLTIYTNDIVNVNGALDDPDAFTKVTVKVFPVADANDTLFFTVALNDGSPLEAPNPYYDGYNATWFKTVNDENLATMSAVTFKGTGAVDNLLVKTGEEAVVPPEQTYTADITLPTGCTLAGVTVDGVSVTPATTIEGLADGVVVAFTYTNADGVAKTATVTINGADGTATTEAYTWADYLGEAVNGAYEIDNLAELKLFQKGIATTTNELKFATAGETFKLTADIALDAPWPGIGVQNGKDIYSTADFNAAAFQGTFDGQNHTISGFQMVGRADNPANAGKQESAWEGLDYCGFFNSTYGATIQNLKIAYADSLFAADTTASTKESGATFVGVAKNSTLRNLTTVAGTVSCSKGFGGIVGYLAGTTVDSCTNNVNMTSLAKNKCGGIAMICQVGGCAILNCQNNGTVITESSNGEFGGIIGYTDSIVISNCQNTAAYKMFYHHGGTVTNADLKGNATVDSYTGQATDGLNFAIVDGNVATFVADGALAAGNTYKVMHAATATFEFTAAGTIAFDTALATPTYAITAASGFKVLEPVTADGVTTYTAEADTPAGTELEPDEQDATVYTTQADAETATNNVTIVASSTVEAALDSTELAAYTAMFEAKVVEVTGGYAIKVGLTEAAATALEDQATDDAAEVIEDLSSATVTLETTPGFYYSFEYGTTLDSMAEAGTRTLATGDSLTLTRPTTAGATSGFYKVLVNVTAE